MNRYDLKVSDRDRDFMEIPTAAQAKEKTIFYEEEILKQRKQQILDLILNEIEAGKYRAVISGGIPKEIKEELKSKGYKIKSYYEEWDCGDVILWG